MTLDDAIYLMQEKINEQKDMAVLYDTHPALSDKVEDYKASAENYEQIVTWLKHYKEICEILNTVADSNYNSDEMLCCLIVGERVIHSFNQKILNIFEGDSE
jgi:hypothetical protein